MSLKIYNLLILCIVLFCGGVSVASEEAKCPPNPPTGQDQGDAWVVGECETLGLIAQRAGVSVQDILAVNPEVCNPNLIYAGQVLKLPQRE